MSDRFLIVETEEARLEGEMHNGNIFLHVVYNEEIPFTPSLLKKFLRIWALAQEALAKRGVREVFSFVTTESDKINKWQAIFGMQPLLELESHILYRKLL